MTTHEKQSKPLWITWVPVLAPALLLFAFLTLAAHVRLGLGHWPRPMWEEYWNSQLRYPRVCVHRVRSGRSLWRDSLLAVAALFSTSAKLMANSRAPSRSVRVRMGTHRRLRRLGSGTFFGVVARLRSQNQRTHRTPRLRCRSMSHIIVHPEISSGLARGFREFRKATEDVAREIGGDDDDGPRAA